MPDSWLEGASPFDHWHQYRGDTLILAGPQNPHPFDLHASIALGYDASWWWSARAHEDAHLLQSLGQGVGVLQIASHRAHAHHQAFLQGGGHTNLHAELVGNARAIAVPPSCHSNGATLSATATATTLPITTS